MSQLQNSSACKIALLTHLEPAPSRLPSWAGRRRRGSAGLRPASRDGSKPSIFQCSGVLQLPEYVKPERPRYTPLRLLRRGGIRDFELVIPSCKSIELLPQR